MEMDTESEMEESLREAACIGDYDTVTKLIKSGINVNSKNNMNGWTALHWAARRNNKDIVQLLLRNGADTKVTNKVGETPASVASDNEIQTILGETVPIKASELPITPSYLKYPTLPICKRLKIDREMPIANSKRDLTDNLILKVRVEGLDPDFIEVELSKAELTVQQLIKVCCEELELESEKIKKIRKIPNTIIRKDKDIQRLSNYQEIELCCI